MKSDPSSSHHHLLLGTLKSNGLNIRSWTAYMASCRLWIRTTRPTFSRTPDISGTRDILLSPIGFLLFILSIMAGSASFIRIIVVRRPPAQVRMDITRMDCWIHRTDCPWKAPHQPMPLMDRRTLSMSTRSEPSPQAHRRRRA